MPNFIIKRNLDFFVVDLVWNDPHYKDKCCKALAIYKYLAM